VKNRDFPSSGEQCVRALKGKRQKRPITNREKLQLPPRFDTQTMAPAANRLVRTKSLILAVLRVWELKHRIRE
jgi:hypothetical protein